MATEVQLIERVRRRFPNLGNGLRVGIGDDAAVIAAPKRDRMGGYQRRVS